MSKALERYQKLGFEESLPRFHRYPIACKELSLILRSAYKKVPKNLQLIIFRDTLTAFRLLPQMQTHSAVSAAYLLRQSVEATLPKQKKKNLAVSEYKNAMVTRKRRIKARQDEKVPGLTQLPLDVLVHIFSFLDMKSLVSVEIVCWLWNMAANDDRLWQTQYTTFFGNSDNDQKCKGRHVSRLVEDEEGSTLFWKEAFKKAYLGSSSKKLKSSRGYCRKCDTIVWLDNMKCSNGHTGLNSENQQINPVSPRQIVEYLLDDSLSAISSSESDSDSSEGSTSRFWDYLDRSQHFGFCYL